MFSTREPSFATYLVPLSESCIPNSAAVSLFESLPLPHHLIMQRVVNAATASLALLFDVLILVLTIRKTWYHVLEMRHLGQTGLMEMLLRDGKRTQFRLLSILKFFDPEL